MLHIISNLKIQRWDYVYIISHICVSDFACKILQVAGTILQLSLAWLFNSQDNLFFRLWNDSSTVVFTVEESRNTTQDSINALNYRNYTKNCIVPVDTRRHINVDTTSYRCWIDIVCLQVEIAEAAHICIWKYSSKCSNSSMYSINYLQ